MKNMKRHWYVVGHRSGARIFEQVGVKPELKLVHSFDNPSGDRRDNELVSDRQGRSDPGMTPGHTPVGSDYKPGRHLLTVFAQEIGAFLEKEATRNAYESLVLVAEPHVLGELKKAMGHITSPRLRAPLIKELAEVSAHDMGAHLKGVLCLREEIGT